MKLQNSYIFLKRNQVDKKAQSYERTADGKTAVIKVGQDVCSILLQAFPDACKEKTDSLFKRKIAYLIHRDDLDYNVTFIVNDVVDITFLDVIVEGEFHTEIVGCLEEIQNVIFGLPKINNLYIVIISYDAISEYYCNEIVPELNSLERNLRKLLLNIYVVNFGREYYKATTDEDFQQKIAGKIRASGGVKKKEEERIKKFFYSFEFSDIQTLLFTPKWTAYDEQLKQRFLKENQNLSNLTDEELRRAFLSFSERNDWDRFFSNKIQIDNIEDIIKAVRNYRNQIAHFKFFYKDDYEDCNQIIRKLNESVLKAIQITEEKDFASKNYQYISDMLSPCIEQLAEMYDLISPTIEKMRELGNAAASAFEKVKKSMQQLFSMISLPSEDVGSDSKEKTENSM